MQKLLFIGILILFCQGLNGQDCNAQGPLIWCTKEKGKSDFDSKEPIYALLFSKNALSATYIDIKTGDDTLSKRFAFPLKTLNIHPKIPSLLYFNNYYFYLLPISPKPYPILDGDYLSFAEWLLETKGNKSSLELKYQIKNPEISGCLHISFKDGLGNFDFNLGKLHEWQAAIAVLENEFIPLLADSTELADLHKRSLGLLKSSENVLSASRNEHRKLPQEEREILEELINLSDSVGFALNKAFISNNREEARHVADITGAFEKRKQELKEEPVYQRIQLTFQNDYRLATTRFGHARTLAQIEQRQADVADALQKLRLEIQKLKEQIQKSSATKN